MLKGTGSAFYLYGRDNDEEYQHVFKEWNSMLILPSHHHEPIITRISKDQLKE
jgi:putative sterol carrier protein